MGFGNRHTAAASIARETRAVLVVVSESSVVRIFDNGELVSEIIPELWIRSKYGHHLTGRSAEKTDQDMMVVGKTSYNGQICPSGRPRCFGGICH